MNLHERGLILFNVLLMINAITLLITMQMQWIHQYLQSVQHLSARKELYQQLEVEANKLVNLNFEAGNASCIMADNQQDAVNASIQILRNGGGCMLKKGEYHYRYLIENLGEYPCLQTAHQGFRYGTKHWRITLLNHSSPTMLVQVRVAERGRISKCQHPQTYHFPLGVLSWRILG